MKPRLGQTPVRRFTFVLADDEPTFEFELPKGWTAFQADYHGSPSNVVYVWAQLTPEDAFQLGRLR
jgi:hypothetical protein